MKPLPPMRRLRVLRLSREGGVAALPGLRRPCAIRLEDCEPPAREALCALLDRALSDAVPEEQAGRGDQRFFQLELLFADQAEELRFSIPEDAAPEALVQLWRDGGLA
ncbi:MAG TPA: protealysin inhibitor emfourin [Pseudomonas sp.]|nr:protealysin inhibitor emfourin [Pseudomonas sp.]